MRTHTPPLHLHAVAFLVGPLAAFIVSACDADPEGSPDTTDTTGADLAQDGGGDDGGTDGGTGDDTTSDDTRDAGPLDSLDGDAGVGGDTSDSGGPDDAVDAADTTPPEDAGDADAVDTDATPEDVSPPDDTDVGPDAGTPCENGLADGDETDVDCGGRCEPCPSASACDVAADCATGLCTDGTCEPWRATGIAVGPRHACAIVQGGRVICWGSNHHGEAGADPATAPLRSPGYVGDAGFAGITDLSAGDAHTCAVRGEEVFCWGDNARGQLGADTATAMRHTPMPVPRTGLASGAAWTALSVAAGRAHTCAAASVPDREDFIMCWGDDTEGQLGRFGPAPEISGPREVLNARASTFRGPFDGLQAGGDHACVVAPVLDASGLARQAVQCWGANHQGQRGESTSVTAAPVEINYSGAFIALSAGDDTTCWVKRASPNGPRTVSCLGFIPANTYSASPTAVELDAWTDAWDVAVDRDILCAVHGESRAVGCLGFPQALGYSLTTPTPIQGLDAPIDTIDAGENFGCALQQDGDVRCWGANGAGQLGDGDGRASPDVARRISP